MPQMKPMNWLMLFILSNMMMMFMNMIIYFNNKVNNELFKNSMKKKNYMNWKW